MLGFSKSIISRNTHLYKYIYKYSTKKSLDLSRESFINEVTVYRMDKSDFRYYIS